MEKKGKKLQKFEYLKNKKGFIDDIKFLKNYHLVKK